MEQNSGEIRSGEAMSIFGQSIDVRRPGRSRRTRRATHKKFSPANDSPARPSLERLNQRRAVTERERGRVESELSRTTGMAQELERQIEQANATARSSHRSELQRTHASGSASSRRKKPGLVVDAEAPGAHQPRDQSNTLLVEVMQELNRVKRELWELQREVKAAREAKAEGDGDAETPTPRGMSPGSRTLDGVEREAGEENEEERGRGTAELALAGGFREGVQAKRALADVLRRDRSLGASDPDDRFATASSSDVGLESADTAVVPATEQTGHAESALTIVQHGEHEHDDRSSPQAAESELTSARVELESIKEEGARFTGTVEHTRMETARVTEEIDRLAEQEERASAQVQQLNAKLLRARTRLDAATAADERAEAVLAELSAALRQLGEETEAAEKERALTELENQCVREDVDTVGAEIAAVEQRVRESVKELEAARESEAVATAKLTAAVEAATLARAAVMSQQTSGNVTISRFEYKYLIGRPEVVRIVAEKKVAAAEAWAETLRAGEKEIAMRMEMIEKEMAQARALEADATDSPSGEEPEPRVGLQRAQTRRPALREGVGSETTGTPSSSVVVRKQRPPPFSIKSRKTRTVVSKYLKVVTGKCGG
ncbi:protein PLASTID MOVEMENT IMPAIRED 15-like [Miscanthus floridulus]|uniref:protein PLASTID MOVEMENT IMPAIRED 15-like n=1 Tax=Miscanthus floridulus TaxID=154761 RepID=UPI003459C888